MRGDDETRSAPNYRLENHRKGSAEQDLPPIAATNDAQTLYPSHRRTATHSASTPGRTTVPLLRCSSFQTRSCPVAEPPDEQKSKGDPNPTPRIRLGVTNTPALANKENNETYLLI